VVLCGPRRDLMSCSSETLSVVRGRWHVANDYTCTDGDLRLTNLGSRGKPLDGNSAAAATRSRRSRPYVRFDPSAVDLCARQRTPHRANFPTHARSAKDSEANRPRYRNWTVRATVPIQHEVRGVAGVVHPSLMPSYGTIPELPHVAKVTEEKL
jgi:hypothetical protein